MPPWVMATVIGMSVILLVLGLAMLLTKSTDREAEARLAGLSGSLRKGETSGSRDGSVGSLLKAPTIDEATQQRLTRLIPNAESLTKLYESADVKIPLKTLIGIAAGLTVLGMVLVIVADLPWLAAPVAGLVLGSLPYVWLLGQKSKRVKQFMLKFPEAMELMGRALRAGHGLASGMNLVHDEMDGPISDEFGRVFDEQNFGVPLEVSLRGMADRVPTLDVRFFVTAVIIQRTTGGDLAEILDKIGKLIRERFELHGHVKALTAEGRLSGMVLMALPPGLVAFLLVANPQYIGMMFSTQIGQKMLGATIVMQIMGALAIKQIVAIKV